MWPEATTGGAPIRIGRDATGEPQRLLLGTVDEVRIADAALYTTFFVPGAHLGPAPGTVGLYHLDEGAGTDVADASGSGNHGQVVGNAAWTDGICGPSGNTAPAAPTVTLVPASPQPGQAITCQSQSTDPDGDPLTYLFAWWVDGVEAVGQTGPTLPGGLVPACSQIICQTAASDGAAQSPVSTASVVIGAGGGGITWYQEHGYAPGGPTKAVNQFFADEAAATWILPPAEAFPLTITHLRALLGGGQLYTLEIREDGFEPGALLAQVSFVADGSYQAVALPTPLVLPTYAGFWVTVSGGGDFWTAYGDTSSSTLNQILACKTLSLFGCETELVWQTYGALGPPFPQLGDLILAVGTETPAVSCE